jgi:hypothetical protein
MDKQLVCRTIAYPRTFAAAGVATFSACIMAYIGHMLSGHAGNQRNNDITITVHKEIQKHGMFILFQYLMGCRLLAVMLTPSKGRQFLWTARPAD